MDTKLYIAGPMRGYPDLNFPAFDDAAQKLRARGYEVVNPAEEDRKHGVKTDPPYDMESIIERIIPEVLNCDGIVLLPGWRQSAGARAEVAVAQWCGGFRFFSWPDFKPCSPTVEADYGWKPFVIGLNGYAGVGKDEAALALMAEGYEVIGFADPMYRIALILNPTIRYGIFPVPLRWLVTWYGWTKAKRIPGVRKYLQKLGTEAGRDCIDPEVWVRAAKHRMKPGRKYVITNVRYPNEAKLCDYVVRITRPGVNAANKHSSEHQDISYDDIVFNDGSKEELHLEIRHTVKHLERLYEKRRDSGRELETVG